MGKKKKPQKTKELSVAIAEASSAGEEVPQQPSQQPLTPRKRGRPRKNVEKIETEEIKEEEAAEVTETQSKQLRITEEHHQKVEEEEEEDEEQQEQKPQPKAEAEASSASMGGMKKGEEQSVAPKQPPTRRTRRKSKPRKSS